jgi:hypothetical protein
MQAMIALTTKYFNYQHDNILIQLTNLKMLNALEIGLVVSAEDTS